MSYIFLYKLHSAEKQQSTFASSIFAAKEFETSAGFEHMTTCAPFDRKNFEDI